DGGKSVQSGSGSGSGLVESIGSIPFRDSSTVVVAIENSLKRYDGTNILRGTRTSSLRQSYSVTPQEHSKVETRPIDLSMGLKGAVAHIYLRHPHPHITHAAVGYCGAYC
ncbi:unnamed protein product, partial [Discosporangium mesarthrocarpum]